KESNFVAVTGEFQIVEFHHKFLAGLMFFAGGSSRRRRFRQQLVELQYVPVGITYKQSDSTRAYAMNALGDDDTGRVKPVLQLVEIIHNKRGVSYTGQLDRLVQQHISIMGQACCVEDQIYAHAARRFHFIGFVFVETTHLLKPKLLVKGHRLLAVAYPNTDMIKLANRLRLLHK